MNARPAVWNLPNILTAARIAITPVVAALPFIDGYWPKLAAGTASPKPGLPPAKIDTHACRAWG